MPGGWYLKIEGKRAGPLTAAQLKALARRGRISPTVLVRQEGGGPWVPAGRVKGLFPVSPAAPEQSVTPAAAEQTISPTAGEQSVSPAAADQSVSPTAAEKSVSPAAPEGTPAAPVVQAPPVQVSTDEPSSSRVAPPAFPQASAVPPAPPQGFHVVGDSPTDRVLRRGRASRGRTWWNSPATLGATAVAMLIAVSAVGIAMIRSGGEPTARPSPASEPVPAKAAGAAAEASEPLPEKAAASVATSTEAKKWDLGIEGLEGLEELGILDSPTEKPRSAEEKKPEKPKPADVAAEAPAEAPGKPAEPPEEDHKLAAEPDDEPDGHVSKIKADITALGGGESDLDYGGDAPREEAAKKPPASSGQKRDGQRAGSPQQRGGEKGGDQRSGSRPQGGGQKAGAQRDGGDKGSAAKSAQKSAAARNAVNK